MNRLPELVYEDLEQLPEAGEYQVYRLLEGDGCENERVPREIDAVLYPYLKGLMAIQLEFWVRPRGGDIDPYQFSAVYQNPGPRLRIPNLSDVPDRMNVPADGLYGGWRCVQNDVFVDIRKTIQESERVFNGLQCGVPAVRIMSVVWLKRFDDRDVTVTDTFQRVPDRFGPVERTKNDGELGVVDVLPVVPHASEPIDEMIEGRPRVVSEVSKNDPPVARGALQESDPEDVLLGGTRLVLANNRVRVTVSPSLNVSIQRFRVRLRPIELEPKLMQRVVWGRDDSGWRAHLGGGA